MRTVVIEEMIKLEMQHHGNCHVNVVILCCHEEHVTPLLCCGSY